MRQVAIISIEKIDAFSLWTLWVTTFKRFITFVKSFILDRTGFHASVSVIF